MTAVSSPPLVSVIMAVYNGELYLRPAVESILGQTLGDFEFLIVDDGSTDASEAILASYADPRIRLIRNEGNLGLAASLNRAIKEARGGYIARMDADDVSLPQRLARQMTFLEANPRIGACSSWVRTMGDGGGRVMQFPSAAPQIRCRLLFDSALCHPAAMFRRETIALLNPVYDLTFAAAQDYDLWGRLSQVTELANLEEVLLLYRQHSGQVTRQRAEAQASARAAVYAAYLNRLGISATAEERSFHAAFHDLHFSVSVDFLRLGDRWLQHLLQANDSTGVFDPDALAGECAYRWFRLCDAATGLGNLAWRTFWTSPLSRGTAFPARQRLRFAVKCALRWQTQGRGRPWGRVGLLSRFSHGKESDG